MFIMFLYSLYPIAFIFFFQEAPREKEMQRTESKVQWETGPDLVTLFQGSSIEYW